MTGVDHYSGAMSPDESPRQKKTSRAAPRVQIHSDISLRRTGYQPAKVDLLDVSTGGCRIEAPERLIAGESVVLRLPGLEAISARVAWVDDWIAGLEFRAPLHPGVFDLLVTRLKR